MKIQDQHFYTFNWNEFVHLEFLRALMRLVPEFDLSTFDDIQTVEKVSVTTDENNENPVEISYISKSGEEKTLHIAPEITKRVNELISERVKINDGNGDAQDWKTITFDWNSENEGEFESIKPLEVSFATDTDSYKFAVPQIILRSSEQGTSIPRAVTFDKDIITIYSTADENGLSGKFQYNLTLYLTKEEAKQIYATIDALNEFKDEVAKTYATQSSLTELSTMLQNLIYEKVNDLTSEQDQIKRSVNTLSGDVENLKGETTQLTSDTTVLKSDMSDVKEKLANVNTEVTTYDSLSHIIPFDVTGFFYDVTNKKAYSVDLNYNKEKTGLLVDTIASSATNESGDHYHYQTPKNALITDLTFTKGDEITEYPTPFNEYTGLYLTMTVYTENLTVDGTVKQYYSTVAKFHEGIYETENSTFNIRLFAKPGKIYKDESINLFLLTGESENGAQEKYQFKIDSLVAFEQ